MEFPPKLVSFSRKALPLAGLGAFLLAVIIHLGLFFNYLNEAHDWGGDFALYLDQAEALLEGNSTELAETNRACMLQSDKRIGPDLYPPGFPLLLSPILAVFGENYYAFKVLNLALFLGSLFLLIGIASNYGFRNQALWAAAFLALLPFFMRFEHEVISDLAAWFFCSLAYFLFLQGKRVLFLLGAGLAIGFAFLIKSLAITLMGALFLTLGLDWLSDRTWSRFKAMLLLFTGTLIPIALSKLGYPDGNSSYMEQIVAMDAAWIWYNVRYYLELPKELMYGRDILFYPWAILFVLGLAATLKDKKYRLPGFFLGLHFILLIAWPYHEGPRFILVLIPVLLLYAFRALAFFGPKLKAYASGTLVLLFFSFAAILSPQELQTYEGRPGLNQARTEEALATYEYIQKHTTDSDILVFFKPRVLRHYTGRFTFMIEDPAQWHTVNADFVLHLKSRGDFKQTSWTPVYENGSFALYEIP